MTKIQDTLGHITAEDGGLNTYGIWKAKQKIIPKDKASNTIAVKYRWGNFITSSEGIEKLCINEMTERLRHGKMHPNL